MPFSLLPGTTYPRNTVFKNLFLPYFRAIIIYKLKIPEFALHHVLTICHLFGGPYYETKGETSGISYKLIGEIFCSKAFAPFPKSNWQVSTCPSMSKKSDGPWG